MVDTIKFVFIFDDNTSDTTYMPLKIGNAVAVATSITSFAPQVAQSNSRPEIIVNKDEIQRILSKIQSKSSASGVKSAKVQSLAAGPIALDESQDPDKIIPFRSSIKFQGSEDSAASGVGKASYYYGVGNNSQKLRKPVILINGFDPVGSVDYNVIYNTLTKYSSGGKTIILGNQLRNLGYDVVVLTFPDFKTKLTYLGGNPRRNSFYTNLYAHGADYIERNAFVLYDLINSCNKELKENGSTEKLVIIGPSMGGLISKYALSYMEKNNVDHNTRLWVSFDSPHLGANIPLGDQSFLDYASVYIGNTDATEARDNKISSPAAQEMLIDFYGAHPSKTSSDVYQSPLRTTFLTNLASLGDFPTKVRKIAIVNGSIKGRRQHLPGGPDLQACQNLLDMRFLLKPSFFLNG